MKTPQFAPFDVTDLDGNTDTVAVRRLSQRLLVRYVAICDKESESIEYVCDRPEGWADTLTDESFVGLLEKVRDLNLKRALALVQRILANAKTIAPVTEQARDLQTLLQGLHIPGDN